MATPYSLVVLDDTGSTQDDAKAALVDRPVLVVSATQTAGRGRRGHRWLTADRAAAVSLAMRPSWHPERLPLIPLIAGIAAARTLPVGLKWPNDLVIDDAKVGGILVEADHAADDHQSVVVGLGLNLWWPDAPEGMAGIFPSDPGPDAGPRFAETWASELLSMIDAGADRWPRGEYRSKCRTIGVPISWEPDGAGVARDIGPDGGLVVDIAGGTSTVLHSGEVRHLRPR